MKVKKFKFKQIIKLHLLKSRAYENFVKKDNSNFLTDSNLTQTIINFKKSLQIIFKYNQTGKTILFIGMPRKLELKINKLTPHIAVPESFNLQGIFSNDNFKGFKTNQIYFPKSITKQLLPKLSKKPDLIVFFLSNNKQNSIPKTDIAKIPVITFSNKDTSISGGLSSLYTVQGITNSSQFIQNRNLFFIGLNFLFKTIIRKEGETNQSVSRLRQQKFRTKKRFNYS